MDHASILRETSRRLGFDALGIASAEIPAGAEHLRHWLSLSYQGEMSWMARNPELRADPRQYDPKAKTIIVAGVSSRQTTPPLRRGRIAAYAQGSDYHESLRDKLTQLAQQTLALWGAPYRVCVDSSPLMEKPIAAMAGLGWLGKNTLIIHTEHGPWLMLGSLLTSLEITPGIPSQDHCGSCTRCLDACPTQAFPQPYILDARRCLAYLTIEHPGPIPEEFRTRIGDRLFGCDECLEVCPWNRHAQQSRELAFSYVTRPDLTEMLAWNDTRFRREFRGTPIFRLKRSRWLRNICIVLGNIGTAHDLPALTTGCRDADPLVREHAAWAVAQIHARATATMPTTNN
ncbi:MAG: tRNA epoxyqueuosine(34) reductase QueG [Verrucomicrobia bacterium]|nr:tRNA epoxyqueuosine(34) reductase QueG [Verrucomicrobiota bacterium]